MLRFVDKNSDKFMFYQNVLIALKVFILENFPDIQKNF